MLPSYSFFFSFVISIPSSLNILEFYFFFYLSLIVTFYSTLAISFSKPSWNEREALKDLPVWLSDLIDFFLEQSESDGAPLSKFCIFLLLSFGFSDQPELLSSSLSYSLSSSSSSSSSDSSSFYFSNAILLF